MKRDEIKDLMEFFDKMGISRMRIKEGDFEIELKKGSDSSDAPAAVPAAAPAPAPINVVVNEKPVQAAPKNTIDSQMVGTFYMAPTPGAAPFVKVGQTVRKDSTICIIEAMKIMNEIQAEFDCRITEILVADGQPVEFGMPLFAVEKL